MVAKPHFDFACESLRKHVELDTSGLSEACANVIRNSLGAQLLYHIGTVADLGSWHQVSISDFDNEPSQFGIYRYATYLNRGLIPP